MSKKKNFSDLIRYNSSAYYTQVYIQYVNFFNNMALSRFVYRNVPSTLDIEYLERTLIRYGIASISSPKGIRAPYATRCMPQNIQNMNGNYTKWIALGENGKQWNADRHTGVIVYDSNSRQCIYPTIKMFAAEISDMYISKRVNRINVKMPVVFSGPIELKNTMERLYSAVEEGKPAFIGFNKFNDIEVNGIKTGIPYIGKDINDDIKMTIEQFMQFIGVKTTQDKKERQTSEEIDAQSMMYDVSINSFLEKRKIACERINKMFSCNMSVSVRE